MILESILETLAEVDELFYTVISLTFLYYLFLTIAQWKLFKKAGEKGWKAFVPVYSLFVSHHLIGMSHIWFILDMILWVVEVVLEFVEGIPPLIEDTFFTIALVLAVIAELLHIMRLCYCYTKSELFGIGLFVIPPLFSMILAFGKSEYHPPRSRREHEAHAK